MEELIVSVNTGEYGSVDDEDVSIETEEVSEEEPFEEDPDEEEPNEVYPFEVEPNEEDPVEEEPDEVDPYKVEPDEEDPEEEPFEEEPEEEPFEEEPEEEEEEEEPMEDPEEEEEPMEDSEEEEEPMEDPERSSPQQCHDEETHQFNLVKMTTPPDTASVSKRVSDEETRKFNSAKMTMPPDTTSVSKRVSDEETLKFNSAKMTMSSDTTSASKGVSDEESLHFNSTKMIVSSDTKRVSRRVYELPSIQNSSSNNVTAPEKPATTQVTGKKRRNKCGAKDEASGLAQDGCKLATKKLKTNKSGANSKSHHVKAIDDSKLFVGFFPHFVDETKLIELFCAFGPISEVKMMRDAGTGSSKGYGYIKYTNYIDAAKAVVQMSGYKIAGRTLTVRIAGIFSSHPGPPVTLQSHPAQPSRLGHPESRPPESVASFPCSRGLKTSSNTSSGQYLAGPLSRSSTSNNALFSGDFVSPNEAGQSPGTLKSNVPQSKKKKKKIKAKCFYCGKYGHLKLECWNYLADIGRGAISEKPT